MVGERKEADHSRGAVDRVEPAALAVVRVVAYPRSLSTEFLENVEAKLMQNSERRPVVEGLLLVRVYGCLNTARHRPEVMRCCIGDVVLIDDHPRQHRKSTLVCFERLSRKISVHLRVRDTRDLVKVTVRKTFLFRFSFQPERSCLY